MPATFSQKNIQLKDVSLFEDLSASELDCLKLNLIERSFKAGEMISFSGEECDGVLIIRSGVIKTSCVSYSGKEQILDCLKAGETCACHPGSGQWKCPSNLQAGTDCQIWFITRRDYEKLLADNPKIIQKLSKIFSLRLNSYSKLIKTIASDNSQSRLARFILDMTDYECNIAYLESLTHEVIANRINLTRETVTRYLNQFKRQNLIEVKLHKISILNRAELEAICL
ncbi:MAG: Crp/Fnr family transcriptional regulator [Candidatus Omnitrophica bacterium]|nr:Crp/Fnr family transcriptional regulator [Candidatus Omnitrophota bacterium]